MRNTGLVSPELCTSSYITCSTGLTGSFLVSLLLLMYTQTNSNVSTSVNIDENIADMKNVIITVTAFEEEQEISRNFKNVTYNNGSGI